MFNPLMGRLAKRLAELTPGDLAISFFANSGTEAVEGALKLARAATKRPAIVSTDAAFHGKTLGALSASGRDAFRDPFTPLLADVRRVPFGDAAALRDAVDATRRGGDHRADPRRGRRERAARRVLARGARDLRCERCGDDRRRGADGARAAAARCSRATAKASSPTS